MAYLLDANVFIQSKNDYYGFDFSPGFWDWLDHANAQGAIASVEKVGEELLDFGDELSEWCRARMARLFLAPDDEVVASLQATALWAHASGYAPAAVATFLQKADYYLVAHAHAHEHTVVTLEKAGATKTIKIPDACTAMDVRCVGLFDMLRTSGVKFVLEKPQ